MHSAQQIRHTRRPSALAVATLLAAVSSASAQTTINWTTTSPAGDSGNWSDTTKWGGANVPDTATELANFGAYANNRTVTLDGAYTVNGLSIYARDGGFAGKTFSLQLPGTPSGSEKLSIGSGGVTLGGGNSVTVSVPLELTADQVWTTANESNQAPATFSGVISGNGKLTRSANGSTTQGSVITFSGANTFSGGFTQNAAINTTRLSSSSVVGGGVIQSGPLGTGTVTLNAGTLSAGAARTISNNVVLGGNMAFGESGSTGTLTFSDANLNTPTTFTLGSANNGAITRVRTANTSLTFDQAIAESGGLGQSVFFTSTSGTPTVTINRTKTATGNLIAGGVALVLNNGSTANSGAVVAVNGSVSATGSNKFSSGGVISDGATLAATDATNFSAVSAGGVTIYNNARLSFATAPTQAQVAGLLSSDSQFRLGLGSGSGNLTVTENYNQAQLGNGRAGLVSGTTGTLTYNGTLTAGSDNTYRVGGGLGTLSLGSALGGANALRVEGGGNVTTSVNHGYTGATTLVGPGGFTGSATPTAGITTLSGAAGALSGTSGITLSSGAILSVDSGGTGNNRLNNSASVTLNSGYLLFNNNTATSAFSETAGNLVVNAGANQINIRTTPAANTVRTIQFGEISRANNAVLVVRGDALGGTGTARNEIKFTNAPTLIGGGGAAGTTNQSIVPWMRGVFDGTLTSGPGRFATYDSNGLRTLNPTSEMVQASSASQVDTAIGANIDRNVRWNPNAASGSNLLSAATTATVNSLWVGNSGSTGASTYGLNSGTINVTSGVVHFQHDASQNMTVNGGTLAFGGTEGVISTNGAGSFLTTLGTNITGTNGVSIYVLNGGGLSLSNTTTSSFSGGLTIGGNGFVAVDQDGRFGNAANNVTHGGGELRFFAGITSSRGLNLLGNVGDNTLGNNNTGGQTVTWNGNITGEGRLRLINNNGANGINGFSLGGSNNYSGGTQIEGVNVTGSTNNALGTGTVTLQNANGNVAALSLTGAAPALGGLRGTDGTVTINPTASTATLTIGANNDNTVFNGVIAQGSGKTGSLTKTGTGHLVLGGVNTYTGLTTVAQGKLSVLGTLASGVTVTGGTLGGTGTISGAVTVQGGGILSPGNSPGVLSVGSGLTLNENSSFAWELIGNTESGRGVSFDGVNVTGGSLSIGAGATASLSFNSTGSTVNWTDTFWASDHQWLVFSNVSAPSITSSLVFDTTSLSLDSVGATLASARPAAGFTWSTENNSVYLHYAVTAVPEPSAFAALAGLGAIGFAALRRRRRA